ncbi:right-handed parallel beta-helix repeat-containing protein [Niabella hibiscisoli]|uniref:right-handed parallel beta-helix repeat-containing protein n=1 Tax=Niabella hibiscisoli TaxID=1825928 RepID=UPI00374DFAA3
MFSASAATYYVATNGDDANAGTIDAPFASLTRAQSLVVAGDIVYIRGGVYTPTNAEIMNNTSDAVRAFVFHMNKSGTAGNPISYIGYPGERPVFDLQNIDPDVLNKRIIVFNVTGSYLHFKNFEIIGTRVLNTTANTQSECIRVNGGNNNIFEHLAMHDGKAIGFYLASGANNLVLNCDAYNNFDNVSGNQRGGNVDGFGAHADRLTSTGNVFRGCRAWYNSDDGFDLISCLTPVTIEFCWAFYNGYTPASTAGTLTATTRAGDGNGFKAGGFGMGSLSSGEQTLDPVPMHTVKYSIAFYNGSNGFYANHHLGVFDGKIIPLRKTGPTTLISPIGPRHPKWHPWG